MNSEMHASAESASSADCHDELDERAMKYHVDETEVSKLDENMTESDRIVREEKLQKMKEEGNKLFKERQFEDAANVYTEALRQCPARLSTLRSILYGNRAACFSHMDDAKLALADCNSALALDSTYLRVLQRRADLYEQDEKSLDKALDDHQAVLKLQPSNDVSMHSCQRLQLKIDNRNAKMKDEMIGQLKTLGNTILKPFGLSTDSFKLQTNADGSYNIQLSK